MIMGRKIPIISFLCGVLTRKRPEEEAVKPEGITDSPASTDGAQSPEIRISTSSAPESATDHQPLPPPPGTGRGHMRTVSCQHHRSSSGVLRLVSSLSMRLTGGGGASLGREEKVKKDHHLHLNLPNKKMFKHEDSIWKKTIILGEKCRVPDEDEDTILYDEKGNKFSTYHPKTHSGVLQFSKQTSCIEPSELSKKIGSN